MHNTLWVFLGRGKMSDMLQLNKQKRVNTELNNFFTTIKAPVIKTLSSTQWLTLTANELCVN